jgi:hypothetical protein
MPTTINVKQHDFESPYSDVEAAVEFRRLMEANTPTLSNNNFAASLFDGARRRGSYTPNQIPWVHVLLAQHEGRNTTPNATSGPALTGLSLIHEHLAGCRERRDNGGKGLKNPLIRLTVGDTNVCLKLTGGGSRNPNCVSVSESHRFGEGKFYGFINAQGELNSKYGVPQEVQDILTRVAQDPARVISEIGKESGRCCYCYAELTTVQSKIAGCGGTCARNYGVDYPNAARTREFLRDNPEILEGSSDAERWI